MEWWHSTPFHFSAPPFRYAIKWQFRTNRKGSLRSTTASTSLSSSKHERPSAPISFRAIKIYPPPHISTVAAFTDCESKWTSREVGNPNFRPHYANSHWNSAMATRFGVETPILRGLRERLA
ncbi:hypothetical protein AVEN_137793-1 [Araneus ventricosus]|uniref:Uncharacterized protein n=1 Tax=Araneus ventricosus TaxID=182803 RepID=A0A4Y2H5Q9_ARAVE|nr:hypothetical protein AVEN_247658-1 [Araneus ventricosus]GBM60089.1 hypothetical protein AVEN_137793-1 [Araneus ventricosus]